MIIRSLPAGPSRSRPTLIIVRSHCSPMCVRITVSASMALAMRLPFRAPLVPPVRKSRSTASPASRMHCCSSSSEPARVLPGLVRRVPGRDRPLRLVEVAVGAFQQRCLGDVDEADRLAEMVLVLVDMAAQDERRDVERACSAAPPRTRRSRRGRRRRRSRRARRRGARKTARVERVLVGAASRATARGSCRRR